MIVVENDDITCKKKKKEKTRTALFSLWIRRTFDGNGIDDFHVFILPFLYMSYQRWMFWTNECGCVYDFCHIIFPQHTSIHQHRSMSLSLLTSSNSKITKEKGEEKERILLNIDRERERDDGTTPSSIYQSIQNVN